jgi:para-nitrobenzyl esterase
MLTRCVLLVFAAMLPLAADNDPVRTDTGLVSGIDGAEAGVRVYKGIPFAAPPVGDLRWKGPKPAAKWDGVRAGDAFGPVCMQRSARGDAKMGEDCLYLNVYTAAASPKEKRPVMVWIYGGALTGGAGSIYNGEDLAKKGVVMVTFNYRLGPFGFFAHPELTKESDRNASGNYGLMDQLAALEWVQRNIAAFGGDTKRVTIFGESAGSWSTNMMMATPLAHGLFHRVIGESGAEFAHVRKLADAEQAGVKFATSMGADSLAALRSKSAADIQAKQGGFQGPDVDGYVLPEDVYTIFSKGKQNDVPLLIGSNSDEGTMFTAATVKADDYRARSEKRYGANAQEFLKIYPFTNDAEAHDASAAAMRDQTFGWEMRTWARLETKTGKSKTYMYYFSRVPPGPDAKSRGAFHSAEISYVFNNVNGKSNTRNVPWEDTDRKLADTMSSYWVNFATTGDPNGKGLLKWPAYHAKDDLLMGFGDEVKVMPIPHKPALDFLDTYFENQRQHPEAQPQ